MKEQALKDSVESLFDRYIDNKRRLRTWNSEEAVKDWVADYRTRSGDGGLSGLNFDNHSSHQPMATSVQERLMAERYRVIERMEHLQLEVNLVELLMLYLGDAETQLIRLRYFERYSVPQICSKLYMSKSSFYRNCSEIFSRLIGPYRAVLTGYTLSEEPPFD